MDFVSMWDRALPVITAVGLKVAAAFAL